MKKSTLLLSTFLLMGCSNFSTSNSVTSNIYKEGELPTAPQEAFQTINNNSSLVSKNYELIFENDNNVYEVHIAKKENHNTLYKTINSIQINIRDKSGLIGYNEKNILLHIIQLLKQVMVIYYLALFLHKKVLSF